MQSKTAYQRIKLELPVLFSLGVQDLARASSAQRGHRFDRAELAEDETSMTTRTFMAVRDALESAGVEFIDDNGGGPGVRLRKRQRSEKGLKALARQGISIQSKGEFGR